MIRAFQRQKPTTKTAAKKEAKAAAYEAAPKNGLNAPKSGPIFVRHLWDKERGCVVTSRRYFFKPTKKEKGWNILGSIDEIEARENAGQRSLF